MPNIRGLDDFPPSVIDQWPAPVRRQFSRYARAGAALRLYRRRGWNDSAVRLQRDRERERLREVIDEWEHREMNPRLF